MAASVPDLLEPPRLTGNAAADSQALLDYSWASYRALKVALDIVSARNEPSGYAGLSDNNQIEFSNTEGTFTSLLTNANSAVRTYTFKDADGTVAFVSDLNGFELLSHKNGASGYAGLSATFQIQFKNTAGTVTSLFTNANSAIRTYTFKDADGTVAFVTDITGGAAAAAFASLVLSGLRATNAAAPTIASAGTIAPTKEISFVSGVTAISTITPPAPIASGGGQITLIPTGLWSTNTAGNIALASAAVVSKALILTYDTTTGKWYPSY